MHRVQGLGCIRFRATGALKQKGFRVQVLRFGHFGGFGNKRSRKQIHPKRAKPPTPPPLNPPCLSYDHSKSQEMLPGATMVALVTFLSSFAGAKKLLCLRIGA